MTARQLMRFYPRAWRARYGEEFVEVIGDRNLSAQQAIDIVAGAVDAWISPSVRAGVRGSAAGSNGGSGRGGVAMIQELKMKCSTSTMRFTTKDGLISAAVLLAVTLAMSAAGIMARRQGSDQLAEFILGLAFPASVVISMPFAVLKGQPRRVQVFVVGITLAILAGATYLATLI